MKDGDYKSALEDLNKALSYNPFMPASLNNRALVFIELNRHTDALGDLNLLLDLIEPTAELLRTRAKVWGKLGNNELMERDLKFAAEIEK
ncbi:Tetratricopeptide repeat protein [compost metagenome]